MSTVSYLDRFLEPVTESFTPELARTFANLRADPGLRAEIDVLRQKANRGTLTPDEEAAYKDFVEALDVLSIDQAVDDIRIDRAWRPRAIDRPAPEQAVLIEDVPGWGGSGSLWGGEGGSHHQPGGVECKAHASPPASEVSGSSRGGPGAAGLGAIAPKPIPFNLKPETTSPSTPARRHPRAPPS